MDAASRDVVGLKLFDALKDNTSVAELHLRLRCLSSPAASLASRWASSSRCVLVTLDLSGTGLNDNGTASISDGLRSNKTVKFLFARACRIGEQGKNNQ